MQTKEEVVQVSLPVVEPKKKRGRKPKVDLKNDTNSDNNVIATKINLGIKNDNGKFNLNSFLLLMSDNLKNELTDSVYIPIFEIVKHEGATESYQEFVNVIKRILLE